MGCPIADAGAGHERVSIDLTPAAMSDPTGSVRVIAKMAHLPSTNP